MRFDYNRKYNTFLYFALRPLTAILCRMVYDFRCIGRENIPVGHKLIVASNHKAFSDPAIIMGSFKDKIYFMAKSELFQNKMLSFLFRHLGAFPVKRNTADRKALRYALSILKENGTVGIFPEGRRVRDENEPEDFKNGVSFLAYYSKADVLPCCIYKKKKLLRSRVILIFGKVIRNEELFPDGKRTSECIQTASDTIVTRIKELWRLQENR